MLSTTLIPYFNFSAWILFSEFYTRLPFSGGPTWWSVDLRGAGAVYLCSAEKWYYFNFILKDKDSFWRIVTWWLCLSFWMLTAALSSVFSLLQSGSNTHYASHYSSFTVYLKRLKFHRFIFVRSSMQEKIQNVLQRNSFRAQCTVTGLVLVFLNYTFCYYEQIGKETSLAKVLWAAQTDYHWTAC